MPEISACVMWTPPCLRPTVELTRRRESTSPPPHQASCETRSRRSRPTICYVAFVRRTLQAFPHVRWRIRAIVTPQTADSVIGFFGAFHEKTIVEVFIASLSKEKNVHTLLAH